MSEKTYIKGKDCDLESTIQTMHAKLKAVGIKVEEASVLNPVPHVYSLHIHDSDYRMMFTNGKGTSKKSCEASALGEYFERLSCNYFFADYYLGEKFANSEFVHYPNEKWFDNTGEQMPEGLLDEKLWNYYDPEDDLSPSSIFDTNSGAGERGICALPFERQRDNKEIYFPVNFIGNIYVSNGMAAGNTKSEARVQALSEIFERYVKNKVIAEGVSLPLIPQEVIERFSQTSEAIEALKAHGYHLRIADASLGGIYPVISVTLINPKDGSVFASFGAHPCFEVALERTVTELLQGRDLDMLDEFQAPSFNMDEVSDDNNLETHFINSSGLLSYDFFKEESDYSFVDWNHDSSTQDEFAYLCQIIHENDFDIYIADYEHLGVYACRIIVPGMSDIYPVADLVWSNNNEGAYFREAILNLKNLDKEEFLQIANELEEGAFNDLQNVAEFIGIVPDADTHWAKLQIGELKAMLYLALGDHEGAQEWNNWSLHLSVLDEERTRHHRCLAALLDIALDDLRDYEEYAPSLELMYGQETLRRCRDIMNQKEIFDSLHSPGLNLEGFETHQKLLHGYEKLHQAKAKKAEF